MEDSLVVGGTGIDKSCNEFPPDACKFHMVLLFQELVLECDRLLVAYIQIAFWSLVLGVQGCSYLSSAWVALGSEQ